MTSGSPSSAVTRSVESGSTQPSASTATYANIAMLQNARRQRWSEPSSTSTPTRSRPSPHAPTRSACTVKFSVDDIDFDLEICREARLHPLRGCGDLRGRVQAHLREGHPENGSCGTWFKHGLLAVADLLCAEPHETAFLSGIGRCPRSGDQPLPERCCFVGLRLGGDQCLHGAQFLKHLHPPAGGSSAAGRYPLSGLCFCCVSGLNLKGHLGQQLLPRLGGFVELLSVATVSFVASMGPPGSASASVPATNGARTIRDHSFSLKSLFVVTGFPSGSGRATQRSVPESTLWPPSSQRLIPDGLTPFDGRCWNSSLSLNHNYRF